MNSERLSNRLEAVASHIPDGSKIADIGSDHAYLPCHVVKIGKVPFAIAGEVVDGPYQSTKRQVEQEGLRDYIQVRKGDGLEVITFGEVECITIAGMGGALITSILDKGKEKLASVKRLILQPNINAISVRAWLLENEWELIGEEILEEDGKIYEIVVAEHGDPKRPYVGKDMNACLLLGPFLLDENSEIFKKKWQSEVRSWERILLSLEEATPKEKNLRKRQELQAKIRMVEEVLQQ